MADTKFITTFQNPNGSGGNVPDAPLLTFSDALGSGPSEWRAILPRAWTAAGIPGDALGSDDLVLAADGSTTWSVYALSDDTAPITGTLWGDFVWGSASWGATPHDGGQLVYRGDIEEVTPTLGKGTEHVEVLVVPYTTQLADVYLPGAVTYTDVDPVDVVRDLIAQGLAPLITWDPRNVPSDVLITQTFTWQTLREVVDYCTQACGGGWVNHINEHGALRIWMPDTTKADHLIQVGREVISAAYTRTRVPQKNRVTVRYKGGDVTAQAVSLAGVVHPTDVREEVVNIPDITDADTALLAAQSLLDAQNKVSLRAKLTLQVRGGVLQLAAVTVNGVAYPASGVVLSAQNRGCPSFSIRPGDTLQLWLDTPNANSFIWGDGIWGQAQWNGDQVGVVQTPQVVQAVTYLGADTLDLDLGDPKPHLVFSFTRVESLVNRALSSLV